MQDLRRMYESDSLYIQEHANEFVKGESSSVTEEMILRYWARSVRFPFETNVELKYPGTLSGKHAYGVQERPETLEQVSLVCSTINASVHFLDLWSRLRDFDVDDLGDWMLFQQREVLGVHGEASGAMYYDRPVPKSRYAAYMELAADQLEPYDMGSFRHFLAARSGIYRINLEELDAVQMPFVSWDPVINCMISRNGEEVVHDWRDDYSLRNADVHPSTHYVDPSGRLSVLATAGLMLKEAHRLFMDTDVDGMVNQSSLYGQRSLFTHLTKNGSHLMHMAHMNVIQDLAEREPLAHQFIDFMAIYSQPEVYQSYYSDISTGEVDHFIV